MAAVSLARGYRSSCASARAAGTACLGRRLSRAREPVHQEPPTRAGSVPALSLPRFILSTLSAGAEPLVHGRLLLLEHRPHWLSPNQHFAARRKRSAPLSTADFIVPQGRRHLEQYRPGIQLHGFARSVSDRGALDCAPSPFGGR